MGILALQAVVTWWIIAGHSVGGRPLGRFGGPEALLSSFLGLYSTAASYFLSGSRMWIGGAPGWWTSPLFWIAPSVPQAAFHFLVPAYLAASLASARKWRQPEEWAERGITPRQFLLAKGLAVLLPFLVLLAAALAAGLFAYIVELGSQSPSPAFPQPSRMPDYRGVALLSLLTSPVLWLLTAALHAAIAAQFRLVFRAIGTCFLVELLLLPIASAGLSGMLGWSTGSVLSFSFYALFWSRFLATGALLIAALGVAAPLAVRSLPGDRSARR